MKAELARARRGTAWRDGGTHTLPAVIISPLTHLDTGSQCNVQTLRRNTETVSNSKLLGPKYPLKDKSAYT